MELLSAPPDPQIVLVVDLGTTVVAAPRLRRAHIRRKNGRLKLAQHHNWRISRERPHDSSTRAQACRLGYRTFSLQVLSSYTWGSAAGAYLLVGLQA
jgi:hypothetical protein